MCDPERSTEARVHNRDQDVSISSARRPKLIATIDDSVVIERILAHGKRPAAEDDDVVPFASRRPCFQLAPALTERGEVRTAPLRRASSRALREVSRSDAEKKLMDGGRDAVFFGRKKAGAIIQSMHKARREKLLLVSMSPIMGGAEIYCARLAKILTSRFELTAVVRNEELKHQLEALGVRVSFKSGAAEGACAYVSAAGQVLRAIFRDRPTVIHFNGQHETYLSFLARLADIPYCVGRVNPLDTPPLRPRFKFPLILGLLRNAQRVFCVSRDIYEELVPLVPSSRLAHIPTWVQTLKPARTVVSEHGPLKVLFIGRLIPEKGLQYVFAALQGVEGIEVTAVGDGPEREKFVELAAGLNVTFHGFSRDLTPFFEAADLVVFPSQEGYEGLPQTPLDTMAAGVPLLASNIIATREILGDTSGFTTFEPANVDDLREKLVYLRDHREVLGTLSELGVARIASTFTEQAVGERYLEIFEAAAASRAAS